MTNVSLCYTPDQLHGLQLASLAFYFIMYVGCLNEYALGVSNLRSAVAEYEVLQNFLHRLSDVADLEDAQELKVVGSGITPSIEFENICFDYGDKKILKNVSFRLGPAQRLGLVGSSGCGKSTIIRLLLRFYRPTSGRILVEGGSGSPRRWGSSWDVDIGTLIYSA